MLKMNNLLKFTEFTHKFQQVERILFVNGSKRNENDSEHSFQLAIVGWYIAQNIDAKLNVSKIIKYALVHDLVEIYAGDTYFYTTNKQLSDSKTERERLAYEKIAQEFQEFPEMSKAIREYEAGKNEEAKFVYALDKIIPVLNIYLDKGRSWQRDKVTYKMARTKDEKVAKSKYMVPIWQELCKLLEKDKHYFFSN